MKLIATAAAAMLATAVSANAATLDFVAEADGNERGVEDGTTINFDGLDVTFSADGDFAYFDDLSGGKPGGLGVCGTLTASDQCNPPSDDNITEGEAVTLTFGTEVLELSGLSFNDADHNSLDTDFTQTLLIALNGGSATQYTFGEAAGAVFTSLTSITFQFDDQGRYASEFYVSGAEAVVPLPAAGWLLLGGLGGLAAMKRRKKAA